MMLEQSRLVLAFCALLSTFPVRQARAAAPPARTVVDEFQSNIAAVAEARQHPPEAIDFPAQSARCVRVLIHGVSNPAEPAIDELEIDSGEGSANLALASNGGVASASSLLPGYPIHQVAHLNDGKYGNDHSWVAGATREQWVQIEWPQTLQVSRIRLTRDRTGAFKDRIPTDVEVLLSDDGDHFVSVKRQNLSKLARGPQIPPLPIERLLEPSWNGLLQYVALRERATWSQIPDDHLSPLRVDRPATPGGPPYWGYLARLEPLERVLFLYGQMIDRLGGNGIDVSRERERLASLCVRAERSGQSEALHLEACQAKRELFLRDPALSSLVRILFVKRHPYLESHNYSEHLDGLLQSGGGVFLLELARDGQGRIDPPHSVVRTLFDAAHGVARDPVADFEARTVYFAYRPETPEVTGWSSYWHMQAIDADGTGLRQLTDGPFHDFDPAVLPDGTIAFMSTRCKSRFLCWRPQAYVLHRMNRDGSGIERLSYANLSEWKPSVLRDGRMLWTRSEYLDKGANFGHTLWSIRPDGTGPELVFGNNTPNCYSQAREVPGTDELVCTLMSHGDHNGPIALIDRSKGPYDVDAITNITPDTRPQYEMDRSYRDTFRDPFPVTRDHFLVSHNPDDQHSWGLYLIDRYGNRELIYLDPLISSFQPTVLRASPRPPVLASAIDAELASRGLGQFTIQDVYKGVEPQVKRGQAKFLQVCQEVPSRLEQLADGEFRADFPPFNDFYTTPTHLLRGLSMSYTTRTPNASLSALATIYRWPDQVSADGQGGDRVREIAGWPTYVAKAVLGTVPIAEDGSASFEAPAGRVLYFQLLDADFNELQRMRSVIQLQPGERRGCVGCHENRRSGPVTHPGALGSNTREPLELTPPPWGTGAFDYETVVQPVLDASCVRCHDGRQPGRIDLRGTLDAERVPKSYRSLIEGGWVHYFDMSYGMRHFEAEPLSFGALRSRLFEVLANEAHREVPLAEPVRQALKAWVSLNCPLWPDYTYRLDRPSKN